jgi:copper chaperone
MMGRMSDTTLTFRVDGMSCAHCEAAVTAEVGQVPGVTAVRVELEQGLVRVCGSGVDPAAVTEAIAEAGYEGALA